MKRSVLLLSGAVAIAAVIVVAALLLPAAEPPPAEEEAAPAPRSSTSPAPTKKPAAAAPRSDGDEAAAKALFDAGRFRECWLTYPSTSWGKRAEDRFRAADAAVRATADRGFEEARARAAALPPAEAVAAWKAYAEKASPDAQAKAEAAAVEVENRNRAAYNDAAARARELAEKHEYAAAAALFDALAKGSTAEVAARCATSSAQLRKAGDAAKAIDASAKLDGARKEIRDVAAPKALAHLKARQYAEALKELGDVAGLEAELKDERAAVELARAYWEAFRKAAAGRSGQEVVLHFPKSKPLSGRLSFDGERATLETPEGPINVPLEQLSLDQIGAWTLGKTLAADDAASYLKAAMFYFAEGRDDLCSTYLATARAKGADITAAERVWREGFLRAALWAAAQPKAKPKPPEK